jgi:hypothetical protein
MATWLKTKAGCWRGYGVRTGRGVESQQKGVYTFYPKVLIEKAGTVYPSR